MRIWTKWWSWVQPLRATCSRSRSFLWLLAALAGISIRSDLLGVTSIVRALGLAGQYYDRLLDFFHSKAVRCLMPMLGEDGLCPDAGHSSSQRQTGASRRWPQDPQAWPQNAGSETPAPSLRWPHQARVHHGPFLSGRLGLGVAIGDLVQEFHCRH